MKTTRFSFCQAKIKFNRSCIEKRMQLLKYLTSTNLTTNLYALFKNYKMEEIQQDLEFPFMQRR